MQPTIIDRNSKLYKFSEFGMPRRRHYELPQDICQFRQMLIIAAIRNALLLGIALVIVAATGVTIYDIFMLCVYGTGLHKISQFTLTLMFVVASLSIGVGAISLTVKYVLRAITRIRKRSANQYKEPTMLKQVYLSWKEKLCYSVEVK